jgi:hypothetical protein
MTQASTSHLCADQFAEAYRALAEYCRHQAEGADDAAEEPWVLLAVAWTKLAEEIKGRSRLAAELTALGLTPATLPSSKKPG